MGTEYILLEEDGIQLSLSERGKRFTFSAVEFTTAGRLLFAKVATSYESASASVLPAFRAQFPSLPCLCGSDTLDQQLAQEVYQDPS